jgi:heme exporter protein D
VTPQDSIAGWVWLAVALAAVLVAGLVLTSRR